MTREEITKGILEIFARQFEIQDPGLEENLGEVYEFDSIDAIDLLREIEILLGFELTRDEKEMAMEIRTIHQIIDYVEKLDKGRSPKAEGGSKT